MLRNKLGLRDQAALDQAEAVLVELRLSQSLPNGPLDASHYRAIHRHMFQDVYAWAGRYRRVRIQKGDSPFCFPEHIVAQMDRTFTELARADQLSGLQRRDFAVECAAFLSSVNAIHPFREGNGRAMKSFLVLLSRQAGHPIDLRRIDKRPYMAAMISAFRGDEAPLTAQIETWIAGA